MSIVISNAFKVIEGRPVTSSVIVAQYFGKQHKDTLRAIRNLCGQMPQLVNQRNFAPVEYNDEKGETRPMYLMDQKGFCILAMGFTGTKALEFKCAFYDEFERMKNELERRSIEPTTLTPAEQRAVQQAVATRAKKTASNYQTIYRAIKARYQIARYDQLPRTQLADCLDFIKEVELSVPELTHTTLHDEGCCHCCGLRPLPEGSIVLHARDAERIMNFVYMWRYLFRAEIELFYHMLRSVQSPHAARFFETFNDLNLPMLEETLKRYGYDLTKMPCYLAFAASK